MTRKEYLESLGFRQNNYQRWIKGYYDEDDIIYIIDYYYKEYKLRMNDYIISDKESIDIIHEDLKELKNIYKKSLKYTD